MTSRSAVLPLAGGALCLVAAAVSAQELEPRAFSPSPVGANFALVVGAYSSGPVVLDAGFPLQDANARIGSATLGYNRTLGFLGRQASVALAVPYAWGTAQGEVGEQFHSVRRSGLGDTRLRLAVNLVGGPALSPAEFDKHRPTTALGLSLYVSAPTGQYDGTRLINLGTNRWAFKPELGLSCPVGNWTFEAYTGAWFYTDNDDFFGGHVLEQSPLVSFQGHVSYTFKPRFWLAGDATFYTGGRLTVAGEVNAEAQNNTRLGLTLSVPIGKHTSIKASWASGIATTLGGKLSTYSLTWQYLWF